MNSSYVKGSVPFVAIMIGQGVYKFTCFFLTSFLNQGRAWLLAPSLFQLVEGLQQVFPGIASFTGDHKRQQLPERPADFRACGNPGAEEIPAGYSKLPELVTSVGVVQKSRCFPT